MIMLIESPGPACCVILSDETDCFLWSVGFLCTLINGPPLFAIHRLLTTYHVIGVIFYPWIGLSVIFG
jgi:hypothetical protein